MNGNLQWHRPRLRFVLPLLQALGDSRTLARPMGAKAFRFPDNGDPMPVTPDSPNSPEASARAAIRVVNYVLIIAAILLLLVCARVIVVSVLVGVGLGVILAPLLGLMQRSLRIPSGLAVALVAIIGLGAIAGLGWGLFSVVESQAAMLADRMPELIERLQGNAQALLSRYPWIERNFASVDVAGSASQVGGALFKGAWSGLATLSALVFALVISLYVAAEASAYHQGLRRAFPRPHRERAGELLRESAATVRVWFRAQLIDMILVAILTSVGLGMVGIDYWLLLGVLTGLFGIIPYVGIAMVVVFASLLALASDPAQLPWVLGVFLLTQQIEGHLILPLVMRGRARLPAVPLLVFTLLLGRWAGRRGALIAPPLFAVLCLLYRELYLPRMDAAGEVARSSGQREQAEQQREQRRADEQEDADHPAPVRGA